MMHVHGGATDVTTYFVLRSSTDGTELTGATITNIDLQYTRSGVAPTAKVDATALAATDSAHADNKAIEIDATDQPGLYRVDWPDAAFAAGVREVILSVKYTGAFTEHLRVMIDPPVNVEQWNATDVPSEHSAGYPVVTVKDGTGTGEINTNGGKVVGVELVDTLTTYTGNTVQTGDSFARLGAPAGASVSADLADVEGKVDDLESRLGSPSDLGSGATVAANLVDIEGQTDDIGAAGAGLTAITGKLPAALTAGGNMKADMIAIDGSTTAATNQKNAATVIYSGTVTGATPTTTTLVDTGLTQSDNDHWNGRIILFLTGSLKYQATDITDFAAGTDTLTFTALTSAPAQNDTYVIL